MDLSPVAAGVRLPLFFVSALGARCFSRLCKGRRAPIVAGASPGAETSDQTVRLSPLPLSSATCLVAKSGFPTPQLRKWFKRLPSSAYMATSLSELLGTHGLLS